MRNPLLIPSDSTPADLLKGIYESLRKINIKLEEELEAKQHMLTEKEQEILALKGIISEKEKEAEVLNKKNADIRRLNEGNRQIIKKLINDVVSKQQDIEWYKRTYETRSLFGTLKEKVFGKIKQ
jgi:hypothetical protein